MTKAEYISMAADAISSSSYPDVEKYTMTMILKMLVKNDKRKTDYTENDFNNTLLESLHFDSVNDCKNLRKLLGLPITKELRYMKRDRNSFIPFTLKAYEIIGWYTDSNSASLKLTFENGETHPLPVLSDYFSHMQKASFEKDIHEQEQNIE